MAKLVKQLIREMFHFLGFEITAYVPASEQRLATLNSWQEAFCDWDAERLGTHPDESRSRYRESWGLFKGGHGGGEFRHFCGTSHELYRVFFDDSPAEIFDAYQFHGLMHFLRQLSYSEPTWSDDHAILRSLAGKGGIMISDFGCGLAQTSISLAKALRAQGASVRICLFDIQTMRLDFLAWLCERLGIPCTMVACSQQKPIPALPPSDVFVVREVFEHLHDPLPYLEAIDGALNGGGFLITNVNDHQAEFMHVSPNLDRVRRRLIELGYDEVRQYQLYRKLYAGASGE
jgi:SAM-dependent methyltransferase